MTAGSDNPIRRRFRGQWSWLFSGRSEPETLKVRREWVGICPHCSDEITWKPGNSSPTRKNTKDALYRHIQQQHGPGLVGR